MIVGLVWIPPCVKIFFTQIGENAVWALFSPLRNVKFCSGIKTLAPAILAFWIPLVFRWGGSDPLNQGGGADSPT